MELMEGDVKSSKKGASIVISRAVGVMKSFDTRLWRYCFE